MLVYNFGDNHYQHVHRQLWLNCLYHMSRKYISCRFLWFLLGMSCGVVLCDHRSYCGDGYLCSWTILNRIIDNMFLLQRRIILSFFFVKCMHELPHGILFH